MKDDPLSNTWSSFLDDCQKDSMSLKALESNVVPALTGEGFAMSSRRTLQSNLEAGIEPLDVVNGTSLSTFVHFLNLVWQPILGYISDVADGKAPQWSEALQANHKALCIEMQGIVCSAEEVMCMDDWVEWIGKTLFRLVGVEVPRPLIAQTVSPVAPFNLDMTPANAMHVLRSTLATKMVGPVLAMQVGRLILAEVGEVPVVLLTEAALNLGVKHNLVATLAQLHCKQDGIDSSTN